MKKNVYYLIFMIILMVFFIAYIVFGDSGDLSSICQELLEKRAECWNSILNESYSYSDFYNDMNSIARGRLLKEDLETFIYLKEYPTDMEKVISVKLYDEEIMRKDNKAFIKAKTMWEMKGLEKSETIEAYYYIELEKHDRNWYIAELEPIE